MNPLDSKCSAESSKAPNSYCDCIPNYYLNSDQKCVLLSDCHASVFGISLSDASTNVIVTPDCSQSASPENERRCQNYCCPRNERLYTENRKCADNTCEKKCNDFSSKCSPSEIQKSGPLCDCIEGTYRLNGTCVALNQCDCKKATPVTSIQAVQKDKEQTKDKLATKEKTPVTTKVTASASTSASASASASATSNGKAQAVAKASASGKVQALAQATTNGNSKAVVSAIAQVSG